MLVDSIGIDFGPRFIGLAVGSYFSNLALPLRTIDLQRLEREKFPLVAKDVFTYAFIGRRRIDFDYSVISTRLGVKFCRLIEIDEFSTTKAVFNDFQLGHAMCPHSKSAQIILQLGFAKLRRGVKV
jgi:hypothetical protein